MWTKPIGDSLRAGKVVTIDRNRPARRRPRSLAAGLIRLVVVWAVMSCLWANSAHGQAACDWVLIEDDCELKILEHRREDGAEFLKTFSRHGTHAFARLMIPPTSVIPELQIRLPIKSNRSGHQILARVVLPRTLHPSTGQPYTVLVPGKIGSQNQMWESLVMNNVVQRLAEQVRISRSHASFAIDSREAFVDQILVNIYGGPGFCEIRMRDPIMQNAVPSAVGETFVDRNIDAAESASVPPSATKKTPPQPAVAQHVCIDGGLLQVDGKPFFSIGIEHQGEDWRFLADLGFNTIHLSHPPTVRDIADAEAHQMWMVAPPPDISSLPDDLHSRQIYRRVLYWDVTNQIDDAASRPGGVIRLAATRRDLPAHRRTGATIPQGIVDEREFSSLRRWLGIVIHQKPTIGTTFDTAKFHDWLADRQQIAQPGWLHFCEIPSEPVISIEQQASGFAIPAIGAPVHLCAIERLVNIAVSTGVRGLVFASHHRLDDQTPVAEQRAAALRVINLKLQMHSPWLAGGRLHRMTVDDDQSIAFAYQTPQAWLVGFLPNRHSHQQTSLTLNLPSSVRAETAFDLSSPKMSRRSGKRVAGGYQLPLPKVDSPTYLLLTHDPRVIRAISRSLSANADESARVEMHHARASWARMHRILRHVSLQDHNQIPADRDQWNSIRRTIESGLEATQPSGSAVETQSGDPLRTAARAAAWRSFGAEEELHKLFCHGETVATPWMNCPQRIGDHLQVLANWQSAVREMELLPGGDCDDLVEMAECGWATMTNDQTHLKSSARLTDALRLHAVLQPGHRIQLVEKPPIWLQSPVISVSPYSVLEISGEWQVDRPITASHDGAILYDSIGGKNLAIRSGGDSSPSGEWRAFRFLRSTGAHKHIQLTVALTGVGNVGVRKLAIRRLKPKAAPQQTADQASIW